jgi:hypothetical protein
MSAFICSDLHFSVIAQAFNFGNVQEMADALKRVNIESVNYRYSNHKPTRYSKVKIQGNAADYTHDDIAKLVHCWIYQACEKDTLAFSLLRSYLENHVKRDNYELGRYWSI